MFSSSVYHFPIQLQVFVLKSYRKNLQLVLFLSCWCCLYSSLYSFTYIYVTNCISPLSMVSLILCFPLLLWHSLLNESAENFIRVDRINKLRLNSKLLWWSPGWLRDMHTITLIFQCSPPSPLDIAVDNNKPLHISVILVI